MQTKIKVALATTISIALTAGAWLAAPSYIKYRVEKDVPGCTVTSVSLHAWHIELHQVALERPGIKASLGRVTVNTDESAHIHGGTVNLDIPPRQLDTPRPTTPNTPSRKITFSNLHAIVTGLPHGIAANLHGVSGTPGGTITIEKATTKHPKFGTIIAESVRSDHGFSSSMIRADSVEVHGFGGLMRRECDRAVFKEVTLAEDWRSVHVEVATCGSNQAHCVQVGWGGQHITAQAETLIVSHPWLNPVPLVLDYSVRADWDGELLALFVGDSAKLGAVVSPARKHMVVTADCAELALRMPLGLAEPLDGIDFRGALDIHIVWDPKDPDVRIKGRCTATCASPRLQALRRPFTYMPYTSSWDRKERRSGPGTSEWIPLRAVAPAMHTATIALEDPGYASHRGYIPQAFRNSLRMNLDKGRFAHGGSTITMQLAKNLWLTRDKTFGRKTQELLLASALENCFNKDEILELYLNVVEFGPDLYGIGGASRRWFQTAPIGLTPRQAFWLASILPRPRKAMQPDEAVLARTEQFVKKLVDAGRVPETMLETIPEGALDGW